MSIFKEKIAARWRAAVYAMDCGGNLFAIVIRCPHQLGIINVRGLWADSLQTVNENWRLSINSPQLVPVKPLFCSLGHTFHATVFVLPARQVEVPDQLRLVVGQHAVALIDPVPFVGRAI